MADREKKRGRQGEKDAKKTVLGISENLEAVLCYALGWITGLIFLLLEKDNRFVRFHALQSLITLRVLETKRLLKTRSLSLSAAACSRSEALLKKSFLHG